MGVIMGANIGTTITGFILALKIGKFGLPLIGVSAFGYLFSRSDRWRYWFMFFLGLGLVFFGLELMKDGFHNVRELPEFEGWLRRFQAESYGGVFLCILVGCVVTLVVQSSSATLGITIALAIEGAIPFETAAALVLGENVGTTITALLASLNATTNARRAAYFHTMFNLGGVAWIFVLFFQYVWLVEWVTTLIVGDPRFSQMQDGVRVFPNVTAAIAITHSVFNIANTLLFLPLLPVCARLLTRFVPERKLKEKPHLTSLDVRMLETPVIGIEQSRVEILRMADGAAKMMDWLKRVLPEDEPDAGLVRKILNREEVLDTIQDEIVAFLTHLLSGNAPHTLTDEGRRQLRMADEYESISDYLVVILKSHLRLRRAELKLDAVELEGLLELHDAVHTYLELVNGAYRDRYPEAITKAHSQATAITQRAKRLRDAHLARLSDARMAPQVNLAYMAMLNAYRRVRDHALNVAEAMAGEK